MAQDESDQQAGDAASTSDAADADQSPRRDHIDDAAAQQDAAQSEHDEPHEQAHAEAAGGSDAPSGAGSEEDDTSSSGRFGAGFATVLGGAVAFVLMLAIGGFLALKLLGGPGSGSEPGPVAVDAPSADSASGQTGGGVDGGGTAGSAKDPATDGQKPRDPRRLRQPNNQSQDLEDPSTGNGSASRGDLSLKVSPRNPSRFQAFRWSGRWPGHDGATLELQYKQAGRWTDYRESATVSGGRYSSRTEAGQSGVIQLRVIDPRSRTVSPVKTIEVP